MKRKKEPGKPQAGKKNIPKPALTAGPEKWKYYLALAVIVLSSFLVYLPVLRNGFVWDDELYIKNNPLIHSINLEEIFSRNVMGNYHPVTMLTLAIEYHFFGLDETGYHAVNLLLHLLNVILVFYAVFMLSNKAGIALVASLLFGIHPLHVESVAWASELKDLLYTFFFLASYICYVKYYKDRQKKFYLFALLLFSVALLSKAMAASLPVVFILTDYFKGRKLTVKTLLEKTPFFLLAIVFGIVAILAQKSAGAVQDMTALSFPQRIIFACYGFISYLFKLIFPLNLSAFYPYPIKSGESISFLYYLYALLFLGFAAAVIYSLRFSKKIFFGIGFFTITVFLVLQLLPVGGAVMADRYSYIPSIGIFYLAGEGFNLLWLRKHKLISIVLLSGFAVFFSVKTYARCGVWENSMTLWNDVISQFQTIPAAYYNRGVVYMDEKKYDRALDDYNKAIELNPRYTDAYNNRGQVYKIGKKYDQALDDFSKSIESNPGFAEAYINRGVVLMDEKKYDQALDDFNKAIELKPDIAGTYYNRGQVFMDQKKYDQALDDFNKAIELNPDYTEVYISRGTLFYFQERYEEAINNYSKAIEIKADAAIALYFRGWANFNSGKKDAACIDMKQAAGLGYKSAADALSQVCK